MVTAQERVVASYSASRFGGPGRVLEYGQVDGDLTVYVLSKEDSPAPGAVSYSTIGMSNFDNALLSNDDVPLRVELVSVASSRWSIVARALSGCAFNVGTGEFRSKPGVVFPGVFEGYGEPVTTPHAFMWYPFSWDVEFDGLRYENLQIEWLQVIPITDAEVELVRDSGAEELVDRLEHLTPEELWSLDRASVA